MSLEPSRLPFTQHIAVVAPGVRLSFEQTGIGDPRVIFLHATGFSGSCWRPHAEQLAESMSSVLVDLRGHGRSSKPPEPYRWAYFVDDIVSLLDEGDWRGVILCGHSVGGATAIQVAARRPDRVSALVLVEPVVPEPRGAPREGASESPLIERTRRRRASWDSREAAAEYLRQRAPYDSWDRSVFDAWVDTGLTDSGTGDIELSCPPWVEASVFAETAGSGAAADLADLRIPTWIARATGDRGMRSTCDPSVAQRIPGAREVVVERSGHFLPLEDIGLVVRLIHEARAASS